MRLYTLRADAFAAVDDEPTAYWLGFLFADGSVTRRGGVTLVLQERDTDHVRAFATFLGSDAPIASLTRQAGVRLNIHSVRLARDLRALVYLQSRIVMHAHIDGVIRLHSKSRR